MPNYDAARKKLENMLDEYMKRVRAINRDIHHEDVPVEKDLEEQATQRENDDVLNALGEDAKEMITKIEIALTAIENGSYGTCTSCGCEIPEDRLEAAPFARQCVDCAS